MATTMVRLQLMTPHPTKAFAMLDDFLVRAFVAGIGLALVAGPLGCFVVWKRLSYFGDTLAHAALLGVAMALLFEINVSIAVFVVAALAALLMLVLQARAQLASDAVLGLLSHGALATGLVALAFMTWIRFDMMGLLFGDLLSVSRTDIAVIYGGGAVALALLIWFWRPLFAVTVNREIAAAEGINVRGIDIVFMLLLAMVVAVSIKIVGVLLITAMLIIPAAAARRVAGTPVAMAIGAAAIGCLAVSGGLWASLTWNTPSGPSIILAAVVLFVLGLCLPEGILRRKAGA
jgi:zinc transport system permease protein